VIIIADWMLEAIVGMRLEQFKPAILGIGAREQEGRSIGSVKAQV